MEEYVIFGASNLGKIAFQKLKDDYNIVGFVDNDRSKINNLFCGLKVSDPKTLNGEEYNIVISSFYKLEIIEQLIELNIKKFSIFEISDNGHRLEKYNYSHINNFDKIDNKVALIIENNSGSNTLALSKNINQLYERKYEIVTLNNSHKKHNYYYELLTSNVIVHTHDSTFNESKINIQLWHGFPLKGISYMNKSNTVNKEFNHIQWNKLDGIASYSQMYSTFMNASYGVDVNKYVITGMPRNDFLFTSDGKSNLSNVLNKDLANKKIIFYMPTFRDTFYGYTDGDGEDFRLLSMDNSKGEKLDRFLKDNNLLLILKVHPMHTNQAIEYIYNNQLNNVHVLRDLDLIEKNLDLYELVNAADLLITDYSSIYFDFLLLDRPIIFIPLDIEEYRKTRGFLAEPYEYWTPGPKSFCYEDFEKQILRSLKDNDYYKDERRVICNMVHHYKGSNSSRRVMNLIDRLICK